MGTPGVVNAAANIGAPAITPYVNASLYVGDLHPEVHEATLHQLFSQAGNVASVRVCRDSVTRQSLGYAYVNFHVYSDAERALNTLNFNVLNGRPIRIMWCQRDPAIRKNPENNVFVKNISKKAQPREFSDNFSKHGNILSCKLPMDPKGEPKGYGFVLYDKPESATTAIAEMNGKEFQNQPLVVMKYLPRDQRPVTQAEQYSNIYIKHFDPKTPVDELESGLKKELEKFGEITSLVIPTRPDGTPKGFAFCNYKTPDAAKAALDQATSIHVGAADKPLYVSRHQNRSTRDKELYHKIHSPNSAPRPNTNLYIKNIDESIPEADLRHTFESYGEITSTKVVMDPMTGRSRGFGFVNYKSPEQAAKAIAEMNGRSLQGKILFVGPFQPKAIRQQMLNAQFSQRYMQQQQQMMFMPPTAMYYPQRPPFYGMVPPRMPPPIRMAQPYLVSPMQPVPQMSQMSAPAQTFPNPGAGRQQRSGPPAASQKQRLPQTAGPIPRPAYPQGQQQKVKYGAQAQNVPQQRPSAGLTATQLAAASPADQKNMLGERLYAQIFPTQGDRAGKITGMLLEMDNSELLILLENPLELQGKVQEAIAVLEAHNAH